MIIMGYDPSVLHAGFGVIDYVNSKKVSCLGWGVVHAHSRDPLSTRLERIHFTLIEQMKHYTPDLFAFETVFSGKNVDTTQKLSMALAVAILAAEECDIPMAGIQNKTVKRLVAGHGNAAKNDVACAITRILKLKTVPEPIDAAEALAIAYVAGGIK